MTGFDMGYYLGLDTSNYTTSLALVSEAGEVLLNGKCLLPVKAGELGLRQADAVFAHIKNLPSLWEQARALTKGAQPLAVGVSEKPRAVEGSYMPCFLSGVTAAEAASSAAGVPLYRFSHQCGHMMAAIHGAGREDLLSRPFGAFHVSGGTTEVLSVSFRENGFSAELLGGSRDLNAGQAIDRVGQMLGLPFPSGPALEALALENKEKLPPVKISVKGLEANLSGVENMAKKQLSDGRSPASVAAFVLDFVAETLFSLASSLRKEKGPLPILFAGGVMSNARIRERLSRLDEVSFAPPEFSRDNAVGIALLCRRAHQNTL